MHIESCEELIIRKQAQILRKELLRRGFVHLGYISLLLFVMVVLAGIFLGHAAASVSVEPRKYGTNYDCR